MASRRSPLAENDCFPSARILSFTTLGLEGVASIETVVSGSEGEIFFTRVSIKPFATSSGICRWCPHNSLRDLGDKAHAFGMSLRPISSTIVHDVLIFLVSFEHLMASECECLLKTSKGMIGRELYFFHSSLLQMLISPTTLGATLTSVFRCGSAL